MKYSAVLITSLTAVASAQDLSVFPACSLPCILDAVGTATTCAGTDFVCVCKNIDALTAAATTCVVNACGGDVALNQVPPATKTFCAQFDSGSGSSSSSVDAASTSSTAETSASPVSSTTDTPAPVSSTTGAADNFTTTSTTSRAATTSTKPSNGATTKTPASVVTAGAATFGSISAAAMMMIAAFAL